MKDVNIESTLFSRVKNDSDLGSELLNGGFDNKKEIKKIISSATYSFEFPSMGVWYGENNSSANIAPLTMGQIVDIERVVRESNKSKKLRMLCSILDKSLSEFSCLDLTVPDFYSLCYEIRLITSKDPIKIVQEINGFKMEKSIYRDSLKVNYLNTKKDLNNFDYPRMRDLIYSLENEEELDSTILKNFFGYCKGETPQEKIENFRSLNQEIGSELIIYSTSVSHGIDSTIKVYNDDGSFEEMEATFEPWMMFPSLIIEILYSSDL